MFRIQSIFDMLSIISFLLSSWLAIRKIFFEGKPNLKLETKFGGLVGNGYEKSPKCIIFSIINKGSGDVHITSIGFLIQNKSQLVIMPGSFQTNPLNQQLPYSLQERKRYEILYPIEDFIKIKEKDQIDKFFVNDQTGKQWKFNIKKQRKKVLM